MQVGCQRGGDSGFVVRDWLANGDLSCLVLHSLSLSLSLSLCSGFGLLLPCCRLYGPPYRSGKPGRYNPEGGAHGCAKFL